MAAVSRVEFPTSGGVVSALVAGTGRPVVLLHGIPTGAELWRDVLSRLAVQSEHGVAPDLPGYGRTRINGHSLSSTADAVASVLDTTGPAHLVGHDFGGVVACLVAARLPESVTRLTLVNSVADTSWPAVRARIGMLAARLGLVAPAARLRLVANPMTNAAVARGFGQRRPTWDELSRVIWDGKVTDRIGRVEFQRHLAALRVSDTDGLASWVREVSVPVHLVWGMRDPFQRWSVAGVRLAALRSDTAVTQLDDCGHFVPLECPERLVAAILSRLP